MTIEFIYSRLSKINPTLKNTLEFVITQILVLILFFLLFINSDERENTKENTLREFQVKWKKKKAKD